METKITDAELATYLSSVLDRVSQGEQFIIVRDGEEVAVLSQVRPSLTASVQEVADKLKSLAQPEDQLSGESEAAAG